MGLQATAQEKYMPLETIFSYTFSDAKIYDDTLFVACENGLYAYSLKTENPKWEVYGFDGMNIRNFVKSDQKIMAVCHQQDDIARLSLLLSYDKGSSYTNINASIGFSDSQVGGGKQLSIHQALDSPDHVFIILPVASENPMASYSGQVLESADFGNQWSVKASKVPANSKIVFASDPNHAMVYGQYDAVDCVCPYLLETKDAFQTITNVAFDVAETVQSFCFTSIACNPINSQHLLAATFEGIVKSEDGGRSWHHTLSWQSQGNQKVLYDPSSAQRAYAFSEEMADWNLYETTVFRTSDGGNTWETIFHNIISGKPDYMMLHDNRLYLTSTMIDYGDGIRSSGFYSIPTDGSATSISHMTEGLHHSSAEAYDLQGRRLTGTSSKGIYIRNGKKYINF